MDDIASLLGRHGFLPHGYCFTWSPGLLWPMVISDVLIALAYFSIPLALWHFMRRRQEPALNGVIGLFCAFIFACGLTHVMDVWTVWEPDYWLQALTKVVTAAISVVTAVLLWPLIPKALAIPSVTQLRTAIASLEAEVVQRRNAENNLADTQEALMITLASIGAGFIATDRNGRVTQLNQAAEVATGWTQDAAVGRSYWEVLSRVERPAEMLARNPVEVMVEQGSTVEQALYFDIVSRTGVRTPIESRVALTHHRDGTVRGLAIVFRDLSRLHEAQAESIRLAAIVESSHDAIIGKTLDGTITSWNQGAQAIFGYSAAEAVGQPIHMLVPPDRQHEEQFILSQVSRGQRVAAFDTVRQRKDGSLVHVSVTISPIHDASGQVVGASKIARDITEQRQAQALKLKGDRLEAENRQIQEANRLKNAFLANMSHELRTPLNAIIGFADLLRSGAVPASSSKHQVFLGHIGTSGRHLLQLINDVLDLSKIEAGKLAFYPEAIDLHAVAREVTEILHALADKQGVRVAIDIDPQVAHLTLDPARLRQVLYNYLSNAIKFTPSGGHVTLRARPQGPLHVRIEVEDNGIGIGPEGLQRLFVEFQQLDSAYTKKHQGTGLGLALTRRLVAAQGGSVGVRSTPGSGSVFHLVLPRVSLMDASDPAPRRFLVIHHDVHAQTRISDSLSKAGFEVDAVATGEQALAQADAQSYDAIALDLVLPDHRGLELLGSIRTQGRNAEAPVVAVTMRAESEGVAGFQIANVLFKPIQTTQVSQALAQAGLTAGRGARVMVVDDDPVALDLMHVTLGTIGLEATCIGGGRQALQALDTTQPDAIILDLMMPDFDGFAVLDALRAMPRWRETPVFIWTSMLLSEAEYARLAHSARAILGKGGGTLTAVLDDLRRWQPLRRPQHRRTTS